MSVCGYCSWVYPHEFKCEISSSFAHIDIAFHFQMCYTLFYTHKSVSCKTCHVKEQGIICELHCSDCLFFTNQFCMDLDRACKALWTPLVRKHSLLSATQYAVSTGLQGRLVSCRRKPSTVTLLCLLTYGEGWHSHWDQGCRSLCTGQGFCSTAVGGCLQPCWVAPRATESSVPLHSSPLLSVSVHWVNPCCVHFLGWQNEGLSSVCCRWPRISVSTVVFPRTSWRRSCIFPRIRETVEWFREELDAKQSWIRFYGSSVSCV